MLYATVKGQPSTARLPVLDPALVSLSDHEALGDLSNSVDRGNIHDYFDTYNPGNPGWGSVTSYGTYGSIAYNIGESTINSGSKPILASETGYCDAAGSTSCVDGPTLAKYVPRIFLEHWLDGISRTAIYQFYDSGASNVMFTTFGLVTAENVPKPSYYALQSLISLLADPGPAFSAKPVTYSLSGNVNNLHHLLLEKRDGTYELVLWLETSGYSPAGAEIAVPKQTVFLRVPSVSTSGLVGTVNEIGNSGRITSTPLDSTDGSATLNVDDHVTIVSVRAR
jgi:hypothetical protein